MFPSILLVLTCDERDPTIIEQIHAAAAGLGARRILVTHIYNQDPVPEPLAGLLEDEERELPPEVAAAVERLSTLEGVEVSGSFRVGQPEVQISELVVAEDIDLVVLGRRAAVGERAGWGSSGAKLLRLIPCSVLIIPQGSTVHLDRVVVGLDFSNAAIHAITTACALSRDVHAVYQYAPPRSRTVGLTSEEFHDKVVSAAEENLHRNVLPEIGADHQPPTLRVVEGRHTAASLIEAAGDDMLVMGHRGLSLLAWALIGSTANRVAGLSQGPVLVIRDKAAVLQGLLQKLASR